MAQRRNPEAGHTMKPLPQRNFCYSTWTHREVETGYPVNDKLGVLDFSPFKFRQIRYSVRKDGSPGASIETLQKGNATRNRKIWKQTRAWFLENILPRIACNLNPAAWLDLAQSLEMPDIATAHGFTLWVKGDRQAWIHDSETEKTEQALAMGAQPSLTP